jgi:enamine deaminase RidA (YjgF/YER057c/UK114 family)
MAGKQTINPPELYDPRRFYTHVVSVQGGKTLYVAGQVAFDKDRDLIGHGDLAAQCRLSFANLKTALEAGGARPADVVKLTIYVKNYTPEALDALEEGYAVCFGSERGFACTLIGVQSLARESLLVEVEAIAVVD